MNKYALFKKNNQRFIAQDLSAGKHFIIGEDRVATYEKGRLIFENGEEWRAYRVWQGAWPKEGVSHTRAIELIVAKHPDIFNDNYKNRFRDNRPG